MKAVEDRDQETLAHRDCTCLDAAKVSSEAQRPACRRLDRSASVRHEQTFSCDERLMITWVLRHYLLSSLHDRGRYPAGSYSTPLPHIHSHDRSMSKKQFKSQASSGRVGTGFGGFGGSGFGTTQGSPLSYIQEPPDYSGISDANVIVAFKNLSKKDSTTKAKALEDIQAYVSSSAEVEDGLLEAWVRLNRVREIAVDSDECISGQTLRSPLH